MSTIKDTLRYVAPEVLTRSYKMSCDLWSLGVLAYSSITGMFPYKAKSSKGCNIIWYKKIVFNELIKARTTKRC